MQGYDVYLDGWALPVTPGKLKMKIVGQNKTISLVNEGQVNLLKAPGLTEVSFTALLPQSPYPFARDSGAGGHLDRLEALKVGKKPFQFIVSRATPGGRSLFHTNLTVSLEDYQVDEDATNGLDISVDIKLRQYREFATKKAVIVEENTATVQQQRPAQSAPASTTHTVVKNDCLWSIAQQHLGNGSRYPEVYSLNQSLIDGANAGTGNPRYTIYPGQVLRLPER